MLIGICNFCKKEFSKRTKLYKFCSLNCSNRFNRNNSHKASLPKPSTDLAEFIGICLGDGCAWGYQTSVTLNSVADCGYIPHVAQLAKTLFIGATISLVKRKDKAVDVRINSKTVTDFLKNNGIISKAKTVPLWILNNPEYRKACVRGLIDTEGYISFKKYLSKQGANLYKQLTFTNYNSELVKFVRDSLINFGFKPTTTLRRNLYLSKTSDIEIYREVIGFSNPKMLGRSLI